MLLAGKFPDVIKLYSALILQELLKIPFCPGALLLFRLLIGFKILHLPPPVQTDHKINHPLHCLLSLLFKYSVTQLSQQH